MITVRKSEERGRTHIDWLDGRHSFSFGNYYDRNHMGFGPLRVINEDHVSPGEGFHPHPHRDMEIITYILEGALEHKDSMGNGSVIVPGDVQYMSAGTGVVHSEFNPQPDKPVHLLQIWLVPDKTGYAPGYQQQNFMESRRPGKVTLLVSKDGRDNSIRIHQDASLSVLDLEPAQTYDLTLTKGRSTWVQMARGDATLNDTSLKQGDGAALEKEDGLKFTAKTKSEILIFDL